MQDNVGRPPIGAGGPASMDHPQPGISRTASEELSETVVGIDDGNCVARRRGKDLRFGVCDALH